MSQSDLAQRVASRHVQGAAHTLPGFFHQFMLYVADAIFKKLGLGWAVSDPAKGDILNSTIWINVSSAAPPPEFKDPTYKWGASITVEGPGLMEVYIGNHKGAGVKKTTFSTNQDPKLIGGWIGEVILKEADFLSGR
jgi:hypothetical protein